MTENHPRPSTWTLIPVVLFFLAVAVLLFGRSMNRRFSHDEHQFVASGVLVADQGLLPYRDFPYHHTPYLTYVNALIFKVTGQLLLSARGASVLFALLGAVVIYHLVRRAFLPQGERFSHLAAAAAVLVLVSNPFFYRTSGKAWNHDLPSLLTLLAVVTLLRAQGRERPVVWMALSGFLIGLAGGVRLSYVLTVPVFALGALIFPPGKPEFNRIRRLAVWGAGLALASLPLGGLFLLAPQKFLYGNFLYPRLNQIYRQKLGHEAGMNLVGKIALLGTELWADWHSLFLYLVFLVLAIGFLFRARDRWTGSWSIPVVFLLVPTLLVGGFLPTPAWRHYFYAPIPLLVLASFIGLGYWVQAGRSAAWISLVLIPLLVGLQAHGLDDLAHLRSFSRPDGWVTHQIHDLGERVADLVGDGVVITLAPIIPLEGGAAIEPGLVNGPFTWRTTNYLSKERQRAFGVIGPQDLDEYLEGDPPAGLMTGFEASGSGFNAYEPGGLEVPLNQYGLDNDYSPVELPTDLIFDPVVLWVRASR
jgi:4-amino-4-deoxy-L-arabinose transferase-like glycosyltransferase